MTVLTFLALWLCLSIIVAGAWAAYREIPRAHQRALARVRRGTTLNSIK